MTVSTAEAEPGKAPSELMACPHCGAIAQKGEDGQLKQPLDMDELGDEVLNQLDLLSLEDKVYMLNNRRNTRIWQDWLDKNGFDYIACIACGHFYQPEQEES